MRTYRYITARDIPFFKDQTFTFDKPGISVILGLNANGQVSDSVAQHNTNGAGKSLFFSLIKEVFFKDGVSTVARDKIKRGEIEIGVDTDKHKYVVRRFLQGKTERYSILEDGKEVSPKDPKALSDKLLDILGCSREAYEVTQYLDTKIPNALRTGDTGVRRKFFTSFFDLESADSFKALVTAEKDALKEEAAVLSELERQLGEMKDLEPLEDLKEMVEAASKKAADLTARQEAMREERQYAQYLTSYKALIKSLMREGISTSLEEFTDAMVNRNKKLRALIQAHSEQTEYNADVKARKRAIETRSVWLKENGLSEEEIDSLPTLVETLGDKLDVARKAQQEMEIAQSQLAQRIEDKVAEIEAKQQELSDLDTAKSCTKCGQPLTQKHAKEEKAELVARISILKTFLKKIRTKHELLTEEVEARREKIKSRTSEHVAYIRINRSVPQIPDKPQRPKSDLPEDFDVEQAREDSLKFKTRIEELRELIGDPRTKAFWNRVRKGDVPEYTDDDYDALTARLMKATQRMTEAQAAYDQNRELRRERKAAKTRILDLKERAQDFEVIQILDKAFASNQGIKQLRINAICRILESQVNRYARFLFPEDYTFEFDLTTQFHILVTRTLEGEKEPVTTDVRKLSGAEAGLFDLLLSISLLTFQHPSKRSNLMILDELDSGFGPGMTEAFINFLPTLNKVIPNLVIITPRSTNDYGESVNYYTVVKQGAHSRILAGKLTKAPAAVAVKRTKKSKVTT